jgi:hypothetical protein
MEETAYVRIPAEGDVDVLPHAEGGGEVRVWFAFPQGPPGNPCPACSCACGGRPAGF